MRCWIERSATSGGGTTPLQRPSEVARRPERVHPVAHGRARWADFFTTEVLTWRGLVTYSVQFFIEVSRRRVPPGGTRHPDSCSMEQLSRKATVFDA
jgi:hypothetical protein